MGQASFDAEVAGVLQELRQHLRAELRVRVRPDAALRQHALAQLADELAITARAWKRLPPVVSDRQGWPARVELWLKRMLQRATRWCFWEQINFNAATNNTLHVFQWLLTDYEQEQAELRAQIKALHAAIADLQANQN